MSAGEQLLSRPELAAKTNNTLFMYTTNWSLLRCRKLDNVLTKSVLWTLIYGVQIFEEKHKPRKETGVIICTLFDYRAWLSLCDRGVKHGSFMIRYNMLITE
jgi:hypothetical protein